MFFSHRRWLPKICKYSLGWVITAGVLGTFVATGQDSGRGGSHRDPWAVESWGGGYGFRTYPPSCHERSYFAGMTPGLPLGDDVAKWPANSFTYQSKIAPLGSIEGHHAYQVVLVLHSKSETTAEGASELTVKRILLERRAKEYCMIFQEQGTVGPLADIVAIEDAVIKPIDAVPVLVTHDMIPGTGGYTLDGAWILEKGTPVSLLDSLGEVIQRADKKMLPPGCQIRPDRNNLDLLTFRAGGQLQPTTDDAGVACEGEVEVDLGIRNHRVIVVSKRLKPLRQ